ncbi:FkbM family methyltransferase, partial [Herbaspirillum chlorophenolicum]|uniref:FkbM family methyltransferase n=1 Tax=Herbaspirillum chlorophenolicum TaxID=211589 RepID=UPI000774680B
ISTQILALQPHNPIALFYLGSASEIQGNSVKAAQHYQSASLTFPHNSDFFECAVRTIAPENLKDFLAQYQERKAGIAGFPNKPAIELVDNPAGKMFVPLYPDDDVISQAIRSGAIFDINIIQCAAENVRSGSTVIDVGANFGQMSLLFARMVGPEGQVVSVEADNYVHHILSENVRVNGLQNVRTICNAAHQEEGLTVFFPDQDFVRFKTFGSYGIDPNAKLGREVKTITIDSLDIQTPVSFMKVDVQGCDLFAMVGAKETIRRHQMPIIFEYEEQFQKEFNTTLQDYVDFVAAIGYKFVKTVDGINYLIAPK